MVSIPAVLACAALATLFWTGVGFPLARRVAPPALAPAFAPALGFAVHGALALPILMVLRLSAWTVILVASAVLVAAFAVGSTAAAPPDCASPHAARLRVPAWAYLAAALVALAPAVALVPKSMGDTVFVAAQIFDHSKIALIDDMVRLGVRSGNPFFGGSEAGIPLAYYYLWHFAAAELAAVCGATGWEADIALTWFTAFTSLALMMGLAVWLGGRAAAAPWAIAIAGAASARWWLYALLGYDAVDAILPQAGGFAGWLFQSAWAPQHLAAASCVVLAVILMCRLAQQRGAWMAVMLALVAAAGFECSSWVGGVTFAAAALPVTIAILWHAERKEWRRFLARLAAAGIGAAVLAAPFLHDQFVATALRHGGSPIALAPFEVLGTLVPERLRGLLNLPAYWLMLLPVELPALYVTGPAAWASLMTSRTVRPDVKAIVAACGAFAATGLAVSCLLASTVGVNDDLGWRAMLPVILAMTAVAAAGLAQWIAAGIRWPAMAAIGAIVLGLPASFGLIRGNVIGNVEPDGAIFAQTPAMWAAVRAHSAPDERVGNNPLSLQHLTPWPVNLSWALLADRRSCYAGDSLVEAFVPLPASRRAEIDAQVIRVFAGRGTAEDVQALATTYDCRLIVVTASDGAWTNDPFANSTDYRLIDHAQGRWRIYRRMGTSDPTR